MKGIDLAAIVLIAAILVTTAIYHIRRRKRGERGCPYCEDKNDCCSGKR